MANPLGYVVGETWRIKRRVTSPNGAPLLQLECILCGRTFTASEAQVCGLGKCSCTAAESLGAADKPIRLPLNLRGWRALPK